MLAAEFLQCNINVWLRYRNKYSLTSYSPQPHYQLADLPVINLFLSNSHFQILKPVQKQNADHHYSIRPKKMRKIDNDYVYFDLKNKNDFPVWEEVKSDYRNKKQRSCNQKQKPKQIKKMKKVEIKEKDGSTNEPNSMSPPNVEPQNMMYDSQNFVKMQTIKKAKTQTKETNDENFDLRKQKVSVKDDKSMSFSKQYTNMPQDVIKNKDDSLSFDLTNSDDFPTCEKVTSQLKKQRKNMYVKKTIIKKNKTEAKNNLQNDSFTNTEQKLNEPNCILGQTLKSPQKLKVTNENSFPIPVNHHSEFPNRENAKPSSDSNTKK
jgi:hypothetical protein